MVANKMKEVKGLYDQIQDLFSRISVMGSMGNSQKATELAKEGYWLVSQGDVQEYLDKFEEYQVEKAMRTAFPENRALIINFKTN